MVLALRNGMLLVVDSVESGPSSSSHTRGLYRVRELTFEYGENGWPTVL